MFGTNRVTPDYPIQNKITVQPTKQNNFIQQPSNVLNRLKYLLFINAIYGVNRLYLLPISNFVRILSHVYSFVIAVCVVYSLVYSEDISATYQVVKVTACIEILLLKVSTFVKKDTLKLYFQDLAEFDKLLNLNGAVGEITSKYRFYMWLICSVVYTAIEFLFLSIYSYQDIEIPLFFYYVATLAHDAVCVFFWSLLRLTWFRLKILKAHAFKILKVNEHHFHGIPDQVELLYENASLDINSLHQAYDLLHQCSSELNSSMNFSMIIMLFTSGLITTLLLKNIFITFQVSDASDPIVRCMIAYALIRCFKYTVLVVIPCFYSSITNKEVKTIRIMLHDAINNYAFDPADRTSRRQLKAFFQLTQENEFSYALWGVIRLNMSLPLSYASLCATYLVIIIQFSKFID